MNSKISSLTLGTMLFIAMIALLPLYKNMIVKPWIDVVKEQDIKMEEMRKIVDEKVTTEKDYKQSLMDSVSYLNPYVDPMIKEQIVEASITECAKYNFPPLLILCIIKQESNFNPLVKNSLDAVGLMQVIPKYHQDKIDKNKWKDYEVYFIKNNILLGTEVLEEYFNQSNDIVSTLQKYVGATIKDNARQYIENIINDYITLRIMFFIDKSSKLDQTKQ